ncbi:MAG TPA: methyl-accepting chemotaxis protein, partial [Methanocella sp.]|nr:methyl-accepting chemotaxis protein [Methanocella sp.]
NLEFNLKLKEADQYTKAEYENFTKINENLAKVQAAVGSMITDVNLLTKAALEGRLSTRADATKHNGEYAKIVTGVNHTLDSVIGPLNVTADYVDRIGKGVIPAKITDTYNGDFNTIKNNINNCIDGLGGLVESNTVLQKLALNDYTSTVNGKYQGIYADVATATNETHKRLVHLQTTMEDLSNGDLRELDGYKKIGKRSENDKLIPAVIAAMEAINLLVADANMLAKAAVEGKLSTRADIIKHKGDYAKVIKGVNDTLDAVAKPIEEAMRISEAYSKGDLTVRVGIQTSGDFNHFAQTLDQTGVGLTATVREINGQVNSLAAALEEATASIEEVMSGTNTLADGASTISTNTENGAQGVKQILKAMEDLSSAVTEVSSKAEATSNLALKADEQSKKGQDLAVKAGTSMVHVTQASQDVAAIIKDIKSQMEQIGKIVQLIQNIADQTNLLALNAAIEAARAGEAGRGFAVVATEVKALAQNSQSSAESISEMIATLQKKSENAVVAMESATKEVVNGTTQVDEALKSFKDIVTSVGDITTNIQHVASATEEQSATVEELTATITEVHQMIDKVAKEAQNSASATGEVKSSMEQIGKVIENVNSISQGVNKQMNKFKVEN